MLCTVDRCCREIISNRLRHFDILGSCGFHRVTSFRHSVMQFRQNIIKIPPSFTGTFGQSESWSVHISSSWKHPALPNEVLNDPSRMQDHNTPNLNTNHSDCVAPGKTEACKGELKVSYVTSQKSFSCLPFSLLPHSYTIFPLAKLQSEIHSEFRLPPPSNCDKDAEEVWVS